MGGAGGAQSTRTGGHPHSRQSDFPQMLERDDRQSALGLSAEANPCRTISISDQPAETDEFGGHTRIADAVWELVTTEPGGRAVGLEGEWGSGKSSIVKHLVARSHNDPNTAVVEFDAWEHEGDPLRRSFLATLVQCLGDKGWLSSNYARRLFATLKKRERIGTVQPIPPSRSDYIGAFFVALLPLGYVLVGFSLTHQSPLAAIAGLVCFLSAPAYFVLASHWWTPPKIGLLISQFPTGTTSTEIPDPTTIEFLEHFHKILDRALQDQRRKVVVVIDNLDRLSAQDARAVWATLRAFFGSPSNDRSRLTAERLWLVVPFGVLSKPEDQLVDETRTRTWSDDDNFLRKVLQLRIKVPMPVASKWIDYVDTVVSRVLPDHPLEEREQSVRIIRRYIALGHEPNPRRLKEIANELGLYHRIWHDDIPLGVITYYVLFRGSINQNSLTTGDLPRAEFRPLLPTDCIPDLASLYYGVPQELALQLLLRQPLMEALTDGNGQAISDLASRTRGVPQALEQLLWELIPSMGVVELGRAARAIADSLEPRGSLSDLLCKGLEDVRAAWGTPDLSFAATVEAFAALGIPDELLARLVAHAVSDYTQVKLPAGAIEAWPEVADRVLRVQESSSEGPRTAVTVHEPALYVAACAWIEMSKSARSFLCSDNERLFDHLAEAIAEGRFAAMELLAARSLLGLPLEAGTAPPDGVDSLVDHLGRRMSQHLDDLEEVSCLFSLAWRLSSWDSLRTALKRTVFDAGWAYHHLALLVGQKHLTRFAAIVFILRCNASLPSIGGPPNSELGLRHVRDAEASFSSDAFREWVLEQEYTKETCLFDAQATRTVVPSAAYHLLWFLAELPDFSIEEAYLEWDIIAEMEDDELFARMVGMAEARDIEELEDTRDEIIPLTDPHFALSVLKHVKGIETVRKKWWSQLNEMTEEEWQTQLTRSELLPELLAEFASAEGALEDGSALSRALAYLMAEDAPSCANPAYHLWAKVGESALSDELQDFLGASLLDRAEELSVTSMDQRFWDFNMGLVTRDGALRSRNALVRKVLLPLLEAGSVETVSRLVGHLGKAKELRDEYSRMSDWSVFKAAVRDLLDAENPVSAANELAMAVGVRRRAGPR